MLSNNEKNGIYLSRSFFDWLLEKNDELTDNYVTFGELFKTYSNSKYKRFIKEQNLMANDFFYHITKSENGIKLERSYDLVFVPVDQSLNGKEAEAIAEPIDDFVVSYSNICTNGKCPEKGMVLNYYYLSKTLYSEFLGFDSFTEERKRYNTKFNLNDQESTLKLTYLEFAITEENIYDLARCNLERELTKRMEANVIRHLMDEVEHLNLVDRRKEYYEIRLFAFVEAIMLLATKEYGVGQKMPIDAIREMAAKRIDNLTKDKNINIYIDGMCQDIRNAWENPINIRILDDPFDYSDNFNQYELKEFREEDFENEGSCEDDEEVM